jgi:hypothetical protein
MTDLAQITPEDLERMATELEADEAAQRARLDRLIRAYARILAVREPHLFVRKATEHGDEAGHWDNSFPPKQEFRAKTGPSLLRVEGWDTEDVATSGGFYYSWRRVTTDGGLYVSKMGELYEADETGTGRFGQFAAHPGDCNVECTIEWSRKHDVSLEQLATAEEHLRKLAFPLSQAIAS